MSQVRIPRLAPGYRGRVGKLQVGNFEPIKEWFLVSVELGGVLNWIQQLPRTGHTGLWRSWFFDLSILAQRWGR